MSDYIEEEEGSGLGLGALAGLGSVGASIIFRKPIGKFVKNYVEDFKSVTRPRDPDALQIPYTRPEERVSASKELVTTDIPVDPEVVKTQSIAEQIRKANLEYKEKMAKAERENPFTLGGQVDTADLPGGSALFNHLAVDYKGIKPMPVSFWVDYFTSKAPKEITYLADGNRVKARVTLDELKDANIAEFRITPTTRTKTIKGKKILDKDDKTLPILKEKFLDRQGIERERRYNKIIDEEKTIFDREVKLVGGYLKYIDDINKLGGEAGEIKVDPVTLMELIQKAPANNISVVSYSSNFVKYYNNIHHKNAANFLDDVFKADANIGAKKDPDGILTTKLARLIDLEDNAANPVDRERYKYIRLMHQALQQSKAIGKHQEMIGPVGIKHMSEAATNHDPKVPNSWNNINHHIPFYLFAEDAIKQLSKPEFRSPKNDKFVELLKEVGPKEQINSLKIAEGVHMNFHNLSPAKDVFDRDDTATNILNPLTGGLGKRTSSVTQYPLDRVYRTLGGFKYEEDTLVINEKGLKTLPGSMRMSPRHFLKGPDGKTENAQIAHVRYHTRFVDAVDHEAPLSNKPAGTEHPKIMLLDEAQSDKQQGAQKKFKERKQKLARAHYRQLRDLQTTASGAPRIGDTKLDQELSNMSPTAYADLYTKPSKDFGDRYVFKEEEMRKNMFNLNTITSATYNDRLLTLVEEMRENVDKGLSRTPEDIKNFQKLSERFNTLRELIPTQNTQRQMTEVDYVPLMDKEVWGPLVLKHLIKKAAREDVQWVGIVPYEVGHHTRTGANLLGNLEFYGNAAGRGDLRKGGRATDFFNLSSNSSQQGQTRTLSRPASAQGATLPSFLKKFAEEHGTEVRQVRVYKSNPNDEVKFIANKEQKTIDKLTGKETDFKEHVGSMTQEELRNLGVDNLKNLPYKGGHFGGEQGNLRDNAQMVIRKKRGETVLHEPDDYFTVFAIKIKPGFAKMPIKTYKRGGLAVNLFKW